MEAVIRQLRLCNEPIVTPPRPRDSIRDRHHLLWAGADMRQAGLNELRSLACTSARGLDSMVHTIIHQRYSGVGPLTGERLDYLTRAGKRQVEHHERGRCGCYQRKRVRIVDAIDLNRQIPPKFDRPPCLGMSVDFGVYQMMAELYIELAPIDESIRTFLEARHDNRACGCHKLNGAEIIFQPAIAASLPRHAMPLV